MKETSIFHDGSWNTWAEHEAIDFGVKKGYQPCVAAGIKNADMVFFDLLPEDQKFVEETGKPLKEEEKVYRYSTYTLASIGQSFPLIKVNWKYKRVYFLEDCEDDVAVFETRGIKLNYARFAD